VKELQLKDPEYAAQVDLENAHRVIRALEVIQLTGKPFSELRTQSSDAINAEIFHVFLLGEREWLYNRINVRVDKMVEEGLFEEVQGLQSLNHLQALNTVGSKEIFRHLGGECSKEEAIVEIKKNTRNYAKRQMTWYRNKPHVRQFDAQKGDVSAEIISLVAR
jgi:tRNA dimethylallyltransferase